MRNDLPQNKFKRALAEKQTQIGLWMTLWRARSRLRW